MPYTPHELFDERGNLLGYLDHEQSDDWYEEWNSFFEPKDSLNTNSDINPHSNNLIDRFLEPTY